MLAAYGIPIVPTAIARERRRSGRKAARRSATRWCSSCIRETITHKTDVGGVQLEPARCGGGAAAPIDDDPRRRSREPAGAAAFPGRDRAADGQARGLRADPRQQHRSAVRAGAAVRRGRAAGRGVQGPRARAAAAQHDAGAAHDGADADLQGAARACAAAQPVDLAALEQLLVRFSQLVVEQPLDQGDRHQPAARVARADRRAGRARRAARPA